MRLVYHGPLLLGCCLVPALARADGGTVRLSERVGGYQVTVFTAPTPFRAGPVDISVLVQDAGSGEPVPDVSVDLRLTPAESGAETLRSAATTAAATNKLFHAAQFDLPAAGWWRVEVAIDGPRGPARVAFDLEAAGPPPRWVELGCWLGWPVVPIVLFGVHQVLVRRRGKGKREERTGVNSRRDS